MGTLIAVVQSPLTEGEQDEWLVIGEGTEEECKRVCETEHQAVLDDESFRLFWNGYIAQDGDFVYRVVDPYSEAVRWEEDAFAPGPYIAIDEEADFRDAC